MPFAINPEGVQAMQQCSSTLSEASDVLRSQVGALKAAVDGNRQLLGTHAEDIDQLTEEMTMIIGQAISPVVNLQEKLNQLAGKYNAIIAKKPRG